MTVKELRDGNSYERGGIVAVVNGLVYVVAKYGLKNADLENCSLEDLVAHVDALLESKDEEIDGLQNRCDALEEEAEHADEEEARR